MERPLIPLTEAHRLVRRTARDFAQNEIAPIAAQLDAGADFPHATVQQMGALGMMGVEVPAAYGGAGLDPLACVLAVEAISQADASHGIIMSVNNSLYGDPLLDFGTEAQKQRYLAPVARGEKIGAHALTESTSGSDAAHLNTRAVLSDDGTHYTITGRKSWVTNGAAADVVLVFCVTDPEADPPHRGITALVVEMDRRGAARGKVEDKLGVRASGTCALVFDGCRCPAANRLGAEGEGFKIAMSALDAARIGVGAQALGIAEAAYAASTAYARERQAFGGRIGALQMIRQKIADMKTRIEAARLLVYRAAMAKQEAKAHGERYTEWAAMAKLYASEAAAFVADEALQIHAAVGYSKELPIERYYRDARITRIYEGTSEIMREIIARGELE